MFTGIGRYVVRLPHGREKGQIQSVTRSLILKVCLFLFPPWVLQLRGKGMSLIGCETPGFPHQPATGRFQGRIHSERPRAPGPRNTRGAASLFQPGAHSPLSARIFLIPAQDLATGEWRAGLTPGEKGDAQSTDAG